MRCVLRQGGVTWPRSHGEWAPQQYTLCYVAQQLGHAVWVLTPEGYHTSSCAHTGSAATADQDPGPCAQEQYLQQFIQNRNLADRRAASDRTTAHNSCPSGSVLTTKHVDRWADSDNSAIAQQLPVTDVLETRYMQTDAVPISRGTCLLLDTRPPLQIRNEHCLQFLCLQQPPLHSMVQLLHSRV